MANKEIKICQNHKNEVPLLSTFRHRGYEYWCPYCGYLEGIFGAGRNVPETLELLESMRTWREKAKKYLSTETNEWTYQQ